MCVSCDRGEHVYSKKFTLELGAPKDQKVKVKRKVRVQEEIQKLLCFRCAKYARHIKRTWKYDRFQCSSCGAKFKKLRPMKYQVA